VESKRKLFHVSILT